MRFIPLFALVAAATAAAQQCAVCRDTIPPGVAEINWTLVFNRTIGDNVMFCGYRGSSFRNPTGKPQTFCEYTMDNGTFIANEESYSTCTKQVELGTCQ
ncbi:hypothetical protein B0H13DRAFT_2357772 [Mycena leptocephala]|nr:hypothetical protein B0H13DRAFT_2357772 [Mycena leptocephala]